MNRSALALGGILVLAGTAAIVRGASLGRLGDGGPARGSAPIATRTQVITAIECQIYNFGGKVAICHATGSHYELLEVSVSACINGHGGHESDFIAPINGCQQ